MSMAFDQAPFNEDKFVEKEFLLLRDKYKIETVIETGTYEGRTTRWLAEHFNKIHTVEINEAYHNTALNYLSGLSNISMYLGNSVAALPLILPKCTDKTILFLDAHWGHYNPLLDELKVIAESKLRPVIIIHDMENPNDKTMGFDVYPALGIVYNWEWIEESIINIYGQNGFDYYYNEEAEGARRGVVYITPR